MFEMQMSFEIPNPELIYTQEKITDQKLYQFGQNQNLPKMGYFTHCRGHAGGDSAPLCHFSSPSLFCVGQNANIIGKNESRAKLYPRKNYRTFTLYI